MEKLGLNQLRSMFQEFYKGKDHYARQSFSLVPEKDKSLLIINSGMAPLKPYFAGLETPPSKRMTTCQKCIRTGDIENVGYTARHGTFFEMLGSFSFGDYFKEESITWGWEFITQVLKMPEDRLWASVYEEDQQAYDIWKNKIGMPEERIVPLGKDDNFWEIGTGPCGPCSEIYFDRGEKYGCDNPDCKPGCDCDRYVEFWNHVFTQFNRDEAGNYTPLAHPNIDTGMGLERLACIMQDVDSIFDVDTIQYILNAIVTISGVKYERGAVKSDVSIRIITDHIRSVTFMIADGILPSNEGRGYVLRRLLRRAARHGKLLGIQGPFLADLSKKVIEVSGVAYPELEERSTYIHKILSVEEEKFSATIDQGSAIINDYIKDLNDSGNTVLSGEKVFKLYDTYGFPLELTQEILEEHGCSADVEGFNSNMLHQKEQARAARKSETDAGWSDDAALFMDQKATLFTGYDQLVDTGIVQGLFWEKQAQSSAKEGDTVILVLDKTPFYAESGGQASDIGMMTNETCTLDVLSVSKVRDVFTHKVKILSGEVKSGDSIQAMVSVSNRNQTARNHTATHILHKALKEVLGSHVEQAGSNVTADGLRFDFTHFEGISKDQLKKIEEIVNDRINHFLDVNTEIMSAEEAIKSGATALFGEKYGEKVRVVSVGEFSTELCGGTHIKNSGQIGAFKIISENGVAAGVRRIEAITGMGLYKKIEEEESLIHAVAETLKTNVLGLQNRAASVTEELKAYKKELEEFKKKSMGSGLEAMIAEAREANGVKLITKAFQDYDINDLRSLSDEIKSKYKSIIIVFATETSGKVTFMVSVSDDLLDKGYHAGNMIKTIAAAAGGGGGGKADMAQAGAKDPSKILAAFDVAASLIG
ncbi:alanine--tRNA ligase [Sinanaerobacter chloroacetimidivorans]|uniref:Alanine--tRNA ligase n=1 Tax=Sinanaerobacter chloroacetimidivorans TaxID=2818044 RepID=A0A8J7VZQ3_9FIRM|nr:alanine--tRNA ligase [Sinanaerobacter chloroacetimidivorans]MBR0596583.1 alanine--tRNA ligase [Sinanaerobacter chloroacetimidivorans]